MSKIVEVDYFTDGSISPKHGVKQPEFGACGYIYLDKSFNVQDSYAAYSYADINYLECLAIHLCLLRIQQISRKGVKYTIFTDSTAVCEALKNVLNNKPTYKDDLFFKQVVRTSELILQMLNENIDIHIIDIKGHCGTIVEFSSYMDKNHKDFDRTYRRLIYRGNQIVDCLVYSVSKCEKAFRSLLIIK